MRWELVIKMISLANLANVFKKKTLQIISMMISVIIISLFLYSCQSPSINESTDSILEKDSKISLINEPITPIPLKLELDENKVKLGELLFHDRQLSGDDMISCASCHKLNHGGVDLLPKSEGINNRIGEVNSPTVFNSGFNFKQFWDGRADTLEEQIEGPINSEIEMGSSWPLIVRKLSSSPEYILSFRQLYSDGITKENIKDAIATFERSLYTPNSRFDFFLRGDKNAITEEEKEGYNRFKNYGCITCHQGVNVGGNLFQTFGLFGNYFKDRGNITRADFGRYNVTGKEEDRYLFKVPSLRNIVLTSPYFHDANAKTLEEAIAIMGKYQLGRNLSSEDIDLIIKFLKTLTGNYQDNPL